MQETWVRSLGWEDPPEKGKAAHPSILAWRIPQTASPMGSQKVRHDWVTSLSFTFHQCLFLRPTGSSETGEEEYSRVEYKFLSLIFFPVKKDFWAPRLGMEWDVQNWTSSFKHDRRCPGLRACFLVSVPGFTLTFSGFFISLWAIKLKVLESLPILKKKFLVING